MSKEESIANRILSVRCAPARDPEPTGDEE